jgi:glucosamine--fructose-6-phosphate aminotransferase (isomerizing)
VHNGVITNHQEIRNQLTLSGYRFKSGTDSEVIANLLDFLRHTQRGMKLEGLLDTLLDILEGEFAVLVLCKFRPKEIFCFRRKSPMVLGVRDTECMFASDQSALGVSGYTTYIPLVDEELVSVRIDGGLVVAESSMSNVPLSERRRPVSPDSAAGGLDGHPNFMWKEMSEIPDVLRRAQVLDLERVRSKLEGLTVLIVGCGSAFYAGWLGQLLRKSLGRHAFTIAYAADEVECALSLGGFDAVIGISQSGETFDTLEPLRQARLKGKYTIGITNVAGSAITEVCNDSIIQGAGVERCVLSTKSILSQVAILYRLFGGSDDALGELADVWARTFKGALLGRIERLADDLRGKDHFFHVGRGLMHAVVLENALKLKEVTYCHAEGMGAGFFKHGTLSLIDERFEVFGHLPSPNTNKEIYDLISANLAEIEARDGSVIRVGHSDECDIRLPSISEQLDPLLHLGFGQYFAYYLAVVLGRDVDQPRSLAKAVTVR